MLPESLHEELHYDELSSVLCHELAHIARHDLAWNVVHTAVNSALFFHPFVWLLRREWSLSQEVA